MNKRITEIDFYRGIIIVLMVIYHLCYDLYYIHNINIPFENNIFLMLQRFISYSFIMICGISSVLSKNNLKRGIKLLIIAYILTFVTFLYDNTLYIKFGILHLLSICTIFYHFIRNFSYKKLVLLLFITGITTIFIYQIKTDIPYLYMLGICNNDFVSSDYFPIFGYINIFILGNIIGKLFYTKKKNIICDVKVNNILVIIGKKSLLIYLLHQPIILFILFLIERIF